VLRFAFETGYAGESPAGLRPKRSEPVKTILAWFAYGRRNAATDYSQSESFDRVTHLQKGSRTGRGRQATQAEEPITDLNVGKFLARLRIHLPEWHPRSLEDELERQLELQKKK